MRIIAGTHRGRPLLPPADAGTTRPITDRVKENLFNRLQTLGVLGYGRVIDAFCGTGSMGLEALSRGAEHCTFVDRDRDAVDRLRRNLDTLRVPVDTRRVVHGGVLPPVWLTPVSPGSLALAFVDPPYAETQTDRPLDRFDPLLDALAGRLEAGGVVVLRTPAGVAARDRPTLDGPAAVTYGKMTLHFYQSPLPEK
ncbi:MAG: RsmD family RNA methyltransferase [Planctomycetota bacterium]